MINSDQSYLHWQWHCNISVASLIWDGLLDFSPCEWVKTKWCLLLPKLFEVDVKTEVSWTLFYSKFNIKSNQLFITFYLSALCELFDKADTGGDGTISIPEYIAMCDEYGIEINDEHINSVKAIANENGEVNTKP